MREKDLFYLVLSSFILTALWVGTNIYHAFATSTISDVLQVQIAPISPNFDPRIIQNLKQREKITPLFTFSAQDGGLSPTPPPAGGPTRTPTPTPTASRSATQTLQSGIATPTP
ncbi:MAG: hypothetical protein HY428_02860 [Candidatus Levybacteria bacterium]|nr:hypothetical protein [Candidatus Levybacteria bacterium]